MYKHCIQIQRFNICILPFLYTILFFLVTIVLSYSTPNKTDPLPRRNYHHATISRILMLPLELAATKVDDCPRQQMEDMNCEASSTSRPDVESVLLNMYDITGIGNALWYTKTCSVTTTKKNASQTIKFKVTMPVKRSNIYLVSL